jgi:hypothetical protein
MEDWEIAIAGDSFTELGHLPYQQLFTTIFARERNTNVLNLGASYTGPLTQLTYLEAYGVGTNTKHVGIVFFEGNDLSDLAGEYESLTHWNESGERPYREFKTQPSLLRALVHALRPIHQRLSPGSEANPVTGYFKSATGNIPVTLTCAPPAHRQLPNEAMHQLHYFFDQYASFAHRRHVTAFLTYMPCKRRVLHGLVDFPESAPEEIKNWQPTDLPEVISALCEQYEITFMDMTPALVQETGGNRELLYNSIYDTHLNRQGSLIVGQELLRQFDGR